MTTTAHPASARDLAERLARLVRIPTVSPADSGPLTPELAAVFARFHDELRAQFPRVFAAATVEVVGRAGLLLRVPGAGDAAGAGPGASAGVGDRVGASAGATALGPVVLMAHQDVVPAPGEEDDWRGAGWSHPPFAGVVQPDEGGALTVYGRGTLDDKGALLVTLEAVERLLAQGWCPEHDLYLSLGADEERDGPSAIEATRVLEQRGVRPALVIDEGGAVVTGGIPGMARPAALVGVAEKGVCSLEIVVSADPRHTGHASMPPRRTATAALGRVMAALEAHPHPAVLDDVTVELFAALAPHLHGPMKLAAQQLRRLRRPLASVLPRLGGEFAAMVRTTTTVTQLQGSSAPNVIAARASAVVNMRVATTSSVSEAVAHVEKVARDAVGKHGPSVRVEVLEASEPTPPSPLEEGWEHVSRALSAAYPKAVVAPYTMFAASDSRHVARIAPAVFRVGPFEMTPEQRASIHGVDERVSADSLVAGVRFYRELLAPSS